MHIAINLSNFEQVEFCSRRLLEHLQVHVQRDAARSHVSMCHSSEPCYSMHLIHFLGLQKMNVGLSTRTST